ncbi:MAG: pyruvate synthase subunit PorA [Chloroflexi bacterium]|jgi:pyruvate ferredoxin oxidoreductase alpha subunit|nr:pyruvate synthase subunit PorA [Chloroflexota bacterium]MBT7080667.1 pyruvate synthase subunit PorA [Chloroflexota bacterium]MBT7289926.1 pyruvate synthase subunit PorA [Chloroflexota bacterium]
MADKKNSKLMILTGNHAASNAVKLCRPDVIAAYPVTPQTQLVEELNRFRAEGEIEAEFVDVESENSAMAVCIGASNAGARVFTATSSFGLVYMYDVFTRAAGHRLPVVMVNANREPPIMGGLARGRQDMLMMRDTGWIQLECQNCQEIFDTVIAAYRLAEDPDVLLPVMVSYDGWYVSFLLERVEIPTQEAVDKFLAPVADVERLRIIPGYPGEAPNPQHAALKPPENFMEVRLKHGLAMEKAMDVIEKVADEFEDAFGREFITKIEEYKTEDADCVLVAMGGEAMTAKVIIDKKREEGKKVGLVRIRMFRPCPEKELAAALKGKKAIGVLEQGIAHGWNRGQILMDLKAVMYNAGENIPMVNFFDGMNGGDITVDHIEKAVDITIDAAEGKEVDDYYWLALPWLSDDKYVSDGSELSTRKLVEKK